MEWTVLAEMRSVGNKARAQHAKCAPPCRTPAPLGYPRRTTAHIQGTADIPCVQCSATRLRRPQLHLVARGRGATSSSHEGTLWLAVGVSLRGPCERLGLLSLFPRCPPSASLSQGEEESGVPDPSAPGVLRVPDAGGRPSTTRGRDVALGESTHICREPLPDRRERRERSSRCSSPPPPVARRQLRSPARPRRWPAAARTATATRRSARASARRAARGPTARRWCWGRAGCTRRARWRA